MRGLAAVGRKSRLVSVLALLTGLGLAGCSDLDSALFAEDDDSGVPAATSGGDQFPPGGGTGGTMPRTMGGGGGGSGRDIAIRPIQIDPGSNTGTAVNATIGGLRADLQRIEDDIVANAATLDDLRSSGSQAANDYHESKARITSRLQMGTTRGNPELVSEWNTAQGALDTLSGSINSLNALGPKMSDDASKAHFILDTLGATYNVAGAVDEDHRQLSVMEDETRQTIVLIDRLLAALSADVQRQTAYVGNERANLTTLAAAIKNGELYSSDIGSPPLASAAGGAMPASTLALAGTPLVVIRFDHPGVDYQQILYAALTQALQARPSAGFSVVAVAPTRGTASAVEAAQTTAKNHAQEVLRSMTDMGVPPSRLAVASATDPSATSSEVRVFVR